MDPIKKAGALVFSDKKLLIVREKGKSHFINPGGRYEEGETAQSCLERELQEELQVNVTSFKPYKTYNISKAATSNRPLVLELYVVEISGDIRPSSEIETAEWLSKEDFHSKKYNVAPSFYEYVPDLIKDNLL